MTYQDFGNRIMEHHTSLHGFALNLTKNMEGAGDLLQDTQMRALSNYRKYADGTNIKAWLFTIMKNIFINDYRKNKRRKVVFDNTENQFLLHSIESKQGNSGEMNISLEIIEQAIQDLDEQFRKPFLLHFEGFKYHEIAETMELPLGTVKSRIFFARKFLKEQLAELAA